MRKVLTASIILFVMMLAVSSCSGKGCKGKSTTPPKPEAGSTVTTPTTPPGSTVTTKPVPVEQYWEIQLKRLEATKKHYEAILAVYTKFKGDTPESRSEVMELQRKNRDAMQEIFKSYGFSSADFYPRGPDRREILQQRQQYMQGNPDLKAKYQALAKEIRDLREKVKAFMPAPGPGTMTPGSARPPMPGMPVPGGQPVVPGSQPPTAPVVPGTAPVAPPTAPTMVPAPTPTPVPAPAPKPAAPVTAPAPKSP